MFLKMHVIIWAKTELISSFFRIFNRQKCSKTLVRPFRTPQLVQFSFEKKFKKIPDFFFKFFHAYAHQPEIPKGLKRQKRPQNHPTSRAGAHRKFWRYFGSVEARKSGRCRTGTKPRLCEHRERLEFWSRDLYLLTDSLESPNEGSHMGNIFNRGRSVFAQYYATLSRFARNGAIQPLRGSELAETCINGFCTPTPISTIVEGSKTAPTPIRKSSVGPTQLRKKF